MAGGSIKLATKLKSKAVKGAAERASAPIDPRYIVPGLSRGLALLQLFTRQRPAQTLAELAMGLGLSRSAAYRLVYTLEKEDFITREADGRHYRLTAKALSLGFEYLNARGLPEVAEPALRSLSDATSAAAYVASLDGWNAVYLARVVPSVALVTNLQVGARLPAHVTAGGRAILAHQTEERLHEIHQLLKQHCRSVLPPATFAQLREQAERDRARGYIYHRSVLNPGLVSLAYPIRNKANAVVGAITAIGPEQTIVAMGGEKALRPHVSEAALGVSQKLGYSGR